MTSSVFWFIPGGFKMFVATGPVFVVISGADGRDAVSGGPESMGLLWVCNRTPSKSPIPIPASAATNSCAHEKRPRVNAARHQPWSRSERAAEKSLAAWRVVPLPGIRRVGQSHCSPHAGQVTWIVPESLGMRIFRPHFGQSIRTLALIGQEDRTPSKSHRCAGKSSPRGFWKLVLRGAGKDGYFF